MTQPPPEVTDLLERRFGLRSDGAAASRMARALRGCARRAGCSPEEFAARLRHDEAALAELVERVTVHESSFFRHEPQFEVVARAAAAHDGGVIWSAGCADGQEAWSLAMLLVERGLTGWSVLGTDISRTAVERARAGRYGERRLRGLSPERRRRFLRDDGGEHVVVDALRERVRFAIHNLVADPVPPEVDGRIVLCRNVLIYLDRQAADVLLERLRARMPRDGVLLIGGAEAIRGDHPHFAARREGEVFVLRRRARAVPDAPPELPAAPPAPDHGRDGERLAAAGDHAAAAKAFGRAAQCAPGDPLALVNLALALDASGDGEAARRAFRAARAALDRTDHRHLERGLGGYSAAALERLIAERG